MKNDYLKTVDYIKKYLSQNGISVNKFFMFGSRARGNYQEDSDYDFLIVIDNYLKTSEKMKLTNGIRNYLIDNNAYLNMDLVIKLYENFEWESKNLGFLSYTVNKEGVLL